MAQITAFSGRIIGNRERLEDYAVDTIINTAGGLNLQIAIVCDGAGGGEVGELAARLTARTAIEYMEISELRSIPRLLVEAVEEANRVVFSELRGSGTSTIAMIAIDLNDEGGSYGRMFIASVGDSRIYLMRGGHTARLNVDHTLANEYIYAGQMSASEAHRLENAHYPTRVIGVNPEIQVDIGFYTEAGNPFVNSQRAFNIGRTGMLLREGDTIFAASDGMFHENPNDNKPYVHDDELLRHALDDNVERAVRNLLRYAENRTPDDNVSISMVFVPSRERRAVRVGGLSRRQRTGISVTFGALIMFMILISGLFARSRAETVNLRSTQERLNQIALVLSYTPTPSPTATLTPTPTIRPTLSAANQVGFQFFRDQTNIAVFERRLYNSPEISYLSIEGIESLMGERTDILPAEIYLQPNTLLELDFVDDSEGRERLGARLYPLGDVFVNAGQFAVGGVQLSAIQDTNIRFNASATCLAARQIPINPQQINDTEKLALTCFTGNNGDCTYEFTTGETFDMPVGSRVLLNVTDRELIEVGSIVYDEVRTYYDTVVDLTGSDQSITCLSPYLDVDGDGVRYPLDLCEFEAGSVAANGCPDADNDGIQDIDDLCPNEVGPAVNNGCPLPTEIAAADMDGDGVSNLADQCPNESGPEENFGCPVQDAGDELTTTTTTTVTLTPSPTVQTSGTPRDPQSRATRTNTPRPIPTQTNTPVPPTNTQAPPPTQTNTPVPTSTPPLPTSTPILTSTPVYTLVPTSTRTNTPAPTATSTPVPNNPPVTANDSYTTDEDVPLNVGAPGVLSNDSDPEAIYLLAIIETGATNGSVLLNGDGSFGYTPNPNFHGSDGFTYRTTDGVHTSNPVAVSITVNSVNDPPSVANDSYSTAEDTPLTIAAPGVLGNDFDVDGTGMSASVVANPANGSVALNPDGSFTYTPDPNYYGTDSFTYQANDGVVNSSPVMVTITVGGTADAPIANNDGPYTTNEDTTLIVNAVAGVLANDTDPDGDPITAVLVTPPASGTLTLNTNGSFTFVPAANFNGSVQFVYHTSDGTFTSANITVSINVTSVNDPPTAVNDGTVSSPITVAEGGVIAVTVIGNDFDIDGTLDLTTVVISNVTNGVAVDNNDGTVTFTHDGSETTTAGFTYTVQDNNGAMSNVATVTITIIPVNDSPVANNDSATVNEGAAVTINVIANDTDVDGTINPGSVNAGSAVNGTLTNNGDGTITYAHNGSETTTGSFTYTVNDNSGAPSNTATVNITVNPVNDPPVANNDSGIVNEGASVTINLTGNDTDADGTISPASVAPGVATNGVVVNNGDGTVTYTHDGSETTTDSFTYTVNDNSGATSNTATVSITVNGVNDGPPVANDDSGTVDEGNAITINVIANDTDPDGNGTITAASVNAGSAINGTLTNNGDGTITYTHNGSETVVGSFTYTVNDNFGATSNTATVNITVNPVNDPPVANNDSGTVNEGASVTINVVGNDTDVDGTIDVASVSAGGTVNGSVVSNGDGTVTYTHDGSETTTGSFTYTVNDNSGATSNGATVNITVTGVNDGPPTANNDTGAVNEGASITINVIANDSDPDGNGTINAGSVAAGGAVNGSVVSNGDGTVTYTHDGSETIVGSFTYTVNDNFGATSNVATVTITITPVNDPPVANNDSGTVNEGGSISINVVGNDSDVDGTLNVGSVAAGGAVNGSVVSNGDGTVTYTHNGSETTTGSFTYTVQDNNGGTSNVATVNITVTPLNDGPPVANNDSDTVNEGGNVTVSVLGNDTDPDGNGTINVASVVAGGAVNGSVVSNGDGTVTYTHDGSETTTGSFTYTVNDNFGATSNLATVNITVTLTNDGPPVANNDSGTVNEGASVTINVLGNDTDPDGNGTIDASTVAAGGAVNGSVVNNGDGTVTYTHDGSETTTGSFTYTVNDTSGATSNVATVNMTVTPVNDGPPIANDDSATVADGGSVVINLIANDNDPDGNGTINAGSVAPSAASSGTLTNNGDGTVTYQHDGSGAGNDSFSYTVNDNFGAPSNAATVSITITP